MRSGSRESSPSLLTSYLGTVPYAIALEMQRDLARRRITGEIDEDMLLLLEHPPVVTLGRTAKEAHLVSSPERLRTRGVDVFEVERGGDVTFHGPGQLVGYPIFDLKRHRRDLHWYLRQVEEALIVGLADIGIPADRNAGYTGVWTRGRKIASIGVHARDWVTWHGFALNVTTDLSFFDLIIPCGIPDVQMTSAVRELNDTSLTMDHMVDVVSRAFGHVFGLEVRAAPTEIAATAPR